MRRLIRICLSGLLTIPFLLTYSAMSQDKDDQKVKVKIITEENGEKEVFERTYESKEEMQNDPEFKKLAEGEGLDIDIDIDEKRMAFVTDSKSARDGKTEDISIEDISINIETEGEGETIKVEKRTKGEDGEESVIEKTYKSWEEVKEDKEMDLSVAEFDGDHGFEWSSEDDGETHIVIKKKKGVDIEEEQEHEIEVVIEQEDGKVKKKVKKRVEIKIDEEEDKDDNQ